MKRIEAIISPDAASSVLEVLDRRDITNFSLYNIMAKDYLGSHLQTYRGFAYAVDLSPEVKLEAVVPDNQATATAYAILDAARGPGRTFKPRVVIAPVTEVIADLRDSAPAGLGDQGHGRGHIEEQPRPDAAAGVNPDAPAASGGYWTAPVQFVKRVISGFAGYLEGQRNRSKSGITPRTVTNQAARVTLANNGSII